MQENFHSVQQAAENYSEYTLALERIANEENGAYVRTSYTDGWDMLLSRWLSRWAGTGG